LISGAAASAISTIFAAIRRASSRVSGLAADGRLGSSSDIDAAFVVKRGGGQKMASRRARRKAQSKG